MSAMRTTVSLPDDLHARLVALAHDRRQSLSQAVTDLLRRALSPGEAAPSEVGVDDRTGLPRVSVGGLVTGEDVRSLEDE